MKRKVSKEFERRIRRLAKDRKDHGLSEYQDFFYHCALNFERSLSMAESKPLLSV
jgi:hypothetical protein